MNPFVLAIVPLLAPVGDPPCTSQWWSAYGVPAIFANEFAPPFGAALAHVDFGQGPEVWVGGYFKLSSSLGGGGLARKTALGWESAGHVNAGVVALLATDLGDGPRIFAGGNFTSIEGVSARFIAEWDDNAWSEPGGGITGGGMVRALASYDDGSGPALYAAGWFSSAGGSPANAIARWDGQTWSALAGGLTGGVFGHAEALAVHDDGSGPALYVGGDFLFADGMPVAGIARWNGSSWGTLDPSLQFGNVNAFAVHDFGSGPRLVAARSVWPLQDTFFPLIAWDGAGWQPVALEPKFPTALASVDDGSGARLWVGSSDGAGLAAYENGTWTGHPTNGTVTALSVRGSPGAQELFATGYFGSVAGKPSPVVASRGRCAETLPVELDGCATQPVRLGAHAAEAKLGHGFPIGVQMPWLYDWTLLFVSDQLMPGVAEGACGVPIANWGDMLLGGAPAPLVPLPMSAVSTLTFHGSLRSLTLPVPAEPSLAGVRLYLQTLSYRFGESPQARLSNALGVRLAP